MDRNTIISIIALGIIFSFAIVIYSDLTRNPNEEIISGTKFISDSGKPSTQLKEFSLRQNFIVSPEFTKQPSPLNAKMTDVITRFNTVFAYAGKSSTVIARTFDSNILVSCYTNEGSYLGGKEITGEECLSQLADPEYLVVKVSAPAGKEALVRITGNAIEIMPKDDSEISSLPHLVLRLMFGQLADTAINSANIKADALGK